MFKNILKILVFVFLGVFLYYLGTLNLYRRFRIKNTPTNQKVAISPTITPFPTINIFNSLEMVAEGVKYTDKSYGVVFTFPQSYSINGTTCNLSIERFSPVPHSPMWNYIHFAVVSENKVDKCDWMGYSGQDLIYNRLEEIKVGQTMTISHTNPEFYKYTRLADEIINKNTFQHFVNNKVWESAADTTKHIFKVTSDKYTVWIMGLTNEDISQPDSIPFVVFKKIVSSLRITKSQNEK